MNLSQTFRVLVLSTLLAVILVTAGCRVRIHSDPTPGPIITPTPDLQTELRLGIIETPNPDGLRVGPLIGRLAPNFRLENLDGDFMVLSDLRGTPVLLNFWAVWCGPCRFEMPEMEKVYQQLDGKVAFVAVDLDEPKERVEAYVDLLGVTFPVVLDDGANVTRVYGVVGFPSTYLIDAEGVIRNIQIGAFLSENEIMARLGGLGFLD